MCPKPTNSGAAGSPADGKKPYDWRQEVIDSGSLRRVDLHTGSNGWASPPGDLFALRGRQYFSHRQKAPSGDWLLNPAGVDWLRSPSRLDNVLGRSDNRVAAALRRARALGRAQKTFLFAVNLQVPGGRECHSAVFYFAAEDTIPPGSLFYRFVHGDDEFRNARFKIVNRIVKGPWIVKTAVGNYAACLLGKALTCNYHRGENYLEIDVDIESSSIAKAILRLALGYVTAVTIDMGFLVEAQAEEELPERLLGAVRVAQMEMGSATYVDTRTKAAESTRGSGFRGLAKVNHHHQSTHSGCGGNARSREDEETRRRARRRSVGAAVVELRQKMEAAAPYLVMTMTQFCLAGFLVILRSVLAPSAGVSATVLVAYQQLLSALVLSLLALLFDRRQGPKPTPKILAWSAVIGLLQIPLGELMFTTSLRYVTATFQSVAMNTIPVVVFVLATATGRERFRFCSLGGQWKLWGTLASATGATIVVLLSDRDSAGLTAGDGGRLVGIVMVGVSVLAEATANLLVERVALQYHADLKLSAMITVFGTLQVAVVAGTMERDLSAWRIKWSGSLELLAIVYGGILVNGVSYFARNWCIHKKGPVFGSAFSPLLVVFSFLLQIILIGVSEELASIVGSVLVILGLYLLLWAKAKDDMVEQSHPVQASTAEPLLPTES
ncbi:WAT1-related protein At2g37460 [Musa acuminata AAA Group]|uniref:WAT1-related protein At2g37460 n=1 Tax=Musa acuminata AAA Group TaxID=214697 RepID=UPI0031DF0CB5